MVVKSVWDKKLSLKCTIVGEIGIQFMFCIFVNLVMIWNWKKMMMFFWIVYLRLMEWWFVYDLMCAWSYVNVWSCYSINIIISSERMMMIGVIVVVMDVFLYFK